MIILVTPHIVTGPLLLITGVTASALGSHTHNHVSCVRGTTRMKAPNMNVQAEQNAAASASAASASSSAQEAAAPAPAAVDLTAAGASMSSLRIASAAASCGLALSSTCYTCVAAVYHTHIYHTPKQTLWLFGRAITPQTDPAGVRTR